MCLCGAEPISNAPRYVPRCAVEDHRQWDGDWQLIDGVAVSMSPSPLDPHERIVSRIGHAFAAAIAREECRCEIYYDLDCMVSEHTFLRPM